MAQSGFHPLRRHREAVCGLGDGDIQGSLAGWASGGLPQILIFSIVRSIVSLVSDMCMENILNCKH